VIVDSIPGTLIAIELVSLDGGSVTVDSAGRPVTVQVAPFAMARTEVTWDAYDVFALGLDAPEGLPPGVDAVARPSRPYGAPDWGFGHAGYPAISVTREAAEAFAEWLSLVTGYRYRVPTEAEWLLALERAFGAADSAAIAERAWRRDNADGTTHPVAVRAPDRLGVFDLLGNAAEWVRTLDGTRVTRGGSYRDDLYDVGARARQTSRWNETDPQIPKSRWWLSDGPFVGFRVVRDP
jgi:formylglycine-generating enzyme required for sulfatase activity